MKCMYEDCNQQQQEHWWILWTDNRAKIWHWGNIVHQCWLFVHQASPMQRLCLPLSHWCPALYQRGARSLQRCRSQITCCWVSPSPISPVPFHPSACGRLGGVTALGLSWASLASLSSQAVTQPLVVFTDLQLHLAGWTGNASDHLKVCCT